MNLTSLSLKELIDLQASIEAAKVRAARDARDQIRRKVMALASESGFTLREIMGGREKAAIKYRDPKTGLTWSGRGRPPRWMKGDREKYAVK